MQLTFDLTGYDKLLNKLNLEELDTLVGYIEQIIEDTQAQVFLESQLIVPVDTSRLRNSGRMHEVTRDSSGIEALISYHTHYALWVHEATHVQFRVPGRRAKYLSDPVEKKTDMFIRRIRTAIEDYFRE